MFYVQMHTVELPISGMLTVMVVKSTFLDILQLEQNDTIGIAGKNESNVECVNIWNQYQPGLQQVSTLVFTRSSLYHLLVMSLIPTNNYVIFGSELNNSS